MLKSGGKSAMTDYRGLIPLLPTDCIEETLHFYQEVLGFEVADSRYEQGGLEWVRLRGGRAQIMFYSPMALGNVPPEFKRPSTLMLYLQTENLSALHLRLKGEGYGVSAIESTFYGMQEFELADPNGYTVKFGEAVIDI
jgi:uncharacterized glyoxalase superfamily protein PhnB